MRRSHDFACLRPRTRRLGLQIEDFFSPHPARYSFSVFWEEMSYIREVYRYPILSAPLVAAVLEARCIGRERASGKMGKRGDVRCDEGANWVEHPQHEGERSRGTRSLDRSGRLFVQLPRYHDERFSKRASRQRAAGSFPSDERYHVIFYPQIPPCPDVLP